MARTKEAIRRQETPGVGKDSRRFRRYFFVLLLSGVVVLSWMSLLTYSPTDPPSLLVYPPKNPVDNAAGAVGAHLAYYLRYWVGAGAYMGLLFASIFAALLMLGGRITDLPWRIVGLALIISATSAAVFLRDPSINGDLLNGSSGILGIGLGRFLLSRFGDIGAWIILVVSFCIGLMFAADNLVLRLPGLGRKVWRQRRQIPTVLGAIRARLPGSGSAASETAGVTSVPRVAAAVPPAIVAATSATLSPRPTVRPHFVQPDRPGKLSKSDRSNAKRKSPDVNGKDYALPSADLLEEPSGGYLESQEVHAARKKLILQQTLSDFGVQAEVVGYMTGPVITLFEVSLAPGVKTAQIAGLATDIARSLAVSGVRIVPPRFGKDTVGIEVPNLEKEIVRIKELMNLAPDAETKMHIPLYFGKDAGGNPIVADLAGMPHMLIAGTTGSGKSVCINSIIMSMLLLRKPEDVRLILVDPKMVEMAAFENIPHLLCPIVNDMRKAEEILEWAAQKMDERYDLLKEAGVKNLASFNALGAEKIYERLGIESEDEQVGITTHLPHYVIIIDELADLMMTSGKEVESHIIRIAQKARAVGIHMVLATQRPSVNVVTGLIKSNMPCRISFRVASRQESRIVLDQNGADVLLGQGDMLFLQPGTSNLIRAQGTFVDDTEIRNIVKELRKSMDPQYNAELVRLQSQPAGVGSGEKDELFEKAVEIVLQTKRGSVSLLQRRLQIGYSRSSRIIDQMADAGILGEYKGSQARECLMTLEDWQVFQASIAADQSGKSSADGEPTSV